MVASCSNCKSLPNYTHTLTLEKPDPNAVANASGQLDLTDADNWVSVCQIRARFITRGGRESSVYKQIEATTGTVLRTPSTTQTRAIDPSWRLKMGTRIFNINTAFLINEIGKEVQIEATERRQP